MYLDSTSTQSNHKSWLIDSCASYHMTPQKEWFYEYQKFGGEYVLLGDDPLTNIVGLGKV